MSGNQRFSYLRCTAACPCQVCGRKKYCMVTEAGDYALCTKVESDFPVPQLEGHRHFIAAKVRLAVSEIRRNTKPVSESRELKSFGPTHSLYVRQLTEDIREQIAMELGITADALWHFDLGYCDSPPALVIPAMASEHQVVGLRHRRRNPSERVSKWHCESGSAAYPLLRITDVESGLPLIITEGPSDCFAATSIGMSACAKWAKPLDETKARVLLDYAARVGASMCIMAGDNDASEGGEVAAYQSAALLQHLQPELRVMVVIPPKPLKDLREWVQKGATAAAVVAQATDVPKKYRIA